MRLGVEHGVFIPWCYSVFFREIKKQEIEKGAVHRGAQIHSKTWSPRILSWQNALSQSTFLLLDKGNEGSGNEIESREEASAQRAWQVRLNHRMITAASLSYNRHNAMHCVLNWTLHCAMQPCIVQCNPALCLNWTLFYNYYKIKFRVRNVFPCLI